MDNDIIISQKAEEQNVLSKDYNNWKKEIILLIEESKLKAILSVNAELLTLYWKIGNDILTKQKEQGWGAKVIVQLSKDLVERFPDDRGYSERNLRNMKRFASAYPAFPIWQVPLAELEKLPIRKAALAELPCHENELVQVPLTHISWYHHISLIAKVPADAERAFYIMETATNGWSRDVMLSQIANGYIKAKGNAITNFQHTLPAYQSDLAQYAFKDPYNFSFLGTVALQRELDIEKNLAQRVTDFLLEMGKGFAFISRQYHLIVDNDDYYIDILMYHLQLHCYVVVELLCCAQHNRSYVA